MARLREQSSLESLDSDFVIDTATTRKLLQNLTISESPEMILQRYLSIRSVISTTSSFACRQQAASEFLQEQGFRAIGAGTCGRIYQLHRCPFVIKRERLNSFERHGLLNDYQMHLRIYAAFKRVQYRLQTTIDVHVPMPAQFITSTDYWWPTINLTVFEENDQSPANLSKMERILPLPKPVREALIDRYCPDDLKDAAKKDRANTDCLVRPYLGKLLGSRRTAKTFFNLRNYPLHCDQFEELGLYESMQGLAIAMADALAIMHWECLVDANDVEFVLGSAPAFKELTHSIFITERPHSFSKGYNLESREVHFWLLDFNQVGEMTMDEAGIDKAVRAFNVKDKYYPRPGRGPPWLWDNFKEQYLATSGKILAGHEDAFIDGPAKFIAGVKSMQAKVNSAQEARQRNPDD